MKKIAVLNIQRCDSHGAVLLAYAMEQIVSDLGFEVATLDYKYAGRITESNRIKKILSILKIKLKKQIHINGINESVCGKNVRNEFGIQHERFESFRKRYLHLTSMITDVNDSILMNYDGFIVGSDVVWKPEIVNCEDRELYFLKSVPNETLKISYAASIGTDDDEVLTKYDEKYKDAFDSLDYISIREQSMISFVQKYTDKKVVSTIDPVFLIEKKKYTKIEDNRLSTIDERPYVYLYILSGNEEAIKRANEYCEKNGYSMIIDLNDHYELSKLITVHAECVISAGPSEFIYNLRHAKYVITDSFHATAFSIIFNIPVCVFDRGLISVRMHDLLDRFNMQNCLFSGEIIAPEEINWDDVNKRIISERENGIIYLRSALNNDK